MFIMIKLILLVYFFRVCLCGEPVPDFDDAASYLVELKEDPAVPNDSDIGVLNATLFKAIKMYYCNSDTLGDELLLFGTNAWTFPAQNVNLTLRYPSQNRDPDREDYVLTGIMVMFHLSSAESRGVITSGGMYQDHISMEFMFRNITSLSYQLYLHGVPRSLLNVTENYTAKVDLC